MCTEDGLAAVYRSHRARLPGRAWDIVGDAGLAEEAVQETFVRAWRACARFDPERGPVVAWLVVILRNVAFDMTKARGRRPGLLRAMPGPDRAASGGLSDEDLMLLRAEVADAMAEITPCSALPSSRQFCTTASTTTSRARSGSRSEP